MTTPLDARIGTLRASGSTITQISETVGLSRTAVCRRTKKPEVKALIQSLSERLARETAETIIENHKLAIKAANKAWQEIATNDDPESAAKLASQAKDLLALADRKEKRAGQAMGLFVAPSTSIFLQNIFSGPTNVVLSDNLAAMLGKIQRQLLTSDDQDDGDIIDLD